MVIRRPMDTAPWSEAFAAAEQQGAFSAATRDRRRAAFERFLVSGMPVTTDEEWKYTSLRALAEVTPVRLGSADTGPAPAHAHDSLKAAPFGHLLEDNTWSKFIIINGRLVPTARTPANGESSVMESVGQRPLAGLDEACKHAPEDGLTWLLRAFRPDAVQVRVPFKKHQQKLFLLSVSGLDTDTNFSCSDLRLHFAEQVEADVIIAQVDLGERPSLRLEDITIVTEAAARVRVLHLQDARTGAHLVTRAGFQVKKNASCSHVFCSTASGLIRNDVSAQLAGPGADLVLNGLYAPRSGGHIDNHTDTAHEVGQTTSNQLYMGLMTAPSHAVFNGRMRIKQGADGSAAHQLNRNLLLATGALVDTKPELQIDTDDVSCSHGATIGALADEEIFYLRSRGLSREEANGLICQGFAAEPAAEVLSLEQRDLYTVWTREAAQLTW